MLDSTEILVEKEPSATWGSWETLSGKLPHKMFQFMMTSINNHLIIPGGSIGEADDYDDSKEIYKFDPTTESWTTLENQLILFSRYTGVDTVLFQEIKGQCVCR